MKNYIFNDNEFKKSSGTQPQGKRSVCVEVAMRKDVIAVRNSNDPEKVTVVFTPEEWKAFIYGVKKNEFDIQ